MSNHSPSQQFPEGKEKYVHDMFQRIARRYDLLNRVLSFRQDVRWRKITVQLANLNAGDAVLDIATGTGDLALELARQVGKTGKVVGVDFVDEMLQIARSKATRAEHGARCIFQYGNAMDLPFEQDTFRAATIGFAMRNVADIRTCLSEMRRVVEPGGRVICLELSKPVWPIFRQLYHVYFHQIVPLIGRMAQGVDGPYRYLPESVARFPDQETLAEIMREIGLKEVTYRNLSGGIAAVHVGIV